MWGQVELESELREWYRAQPDGEADRVRFHIDRLSELGATLDEPHTRQLDGKLRELRFYLSGRPTRITYWIAPGLTVFVKTQRQERQEIRRAKQAMERCAAEAHTADEEE